MTPRKFDKPDRPFNKFRKDGPPRSEAEAEGERPFRKPFGHDPRAQYDDEQFTATGELAEIVGTHPLDRREILRRMWRHYQDAGMVKSIGGGRPRPRRFEREGSEGPRRFEDRPPRRFEDRPPRRSARDGESGPRRYGRIPEDGERRFSRDREEGPRPFSPHGPPSRRPRVSTRTPSGKHPSGKRAETLSKVPRRKFKDTRERDEG